MNSAGTGEDVYDQQQTFSGCNNLIGNGEGQTAIVDGAGGNLVGTTEVPVDPMLSEISQLPNGSWGYYLLPGSPALDSGDNDLAVDSNGDPLEMDQAGQSRIQNEIVDMGAVEGVHTRPSQTYVVTSLSNVVDPDDGELTFWEAFEASQSNRAIGDAQAGSFEEPDVIQFAVGTHGTVLLEARALWVFGSLEIEGPGADLLTFDAQGHSGVFQIGPDVSLPFERDEHHGRRRRIWRRHLCRSCRTRSRRCERIRKHRNPIRRRNRNR